MKKFYLNPWFIYSVLALAVLLPLLKPGYVFALDMVFGPKIHLPNEVTSSYPFYLFLWLLNFVIPSQIIQKSILFAVILLCGVGAYKLSEYVIRNSKIETRSSFIPCYFAGFLYTVNPFTYERFMDGQFNVLLGYALLPFFAHSLFEVIFIKKTSSKALLKLTVYTLLISIVSIHAVGYMAAVGLAAVLVAAIKYQKDTQSLKKTLYKLLTVIVIVLVASSYWLMPTLLGKTTRSGQIKSFDDRQLLSFRTDGSAAVSVVGNSLGLYGYWGERQDRFIVPKNQMYFWPVLAFIIFALTTYGFYCGRRIPHVQVIAISGLLGLVLAIGIAAPPFKYFNQFLVDHLPYFRGYREPQKFLSLLALAYAVLGGMGLANLYKRTKQGYKPLVYLALLLPFVYTPTFLWGFANQLHSKDYPADWYAANNQYIKNSQGATLFLPWHLYMYFDFAGRSIANPAPRFFNGKVIAGDNSEIGLIKSKPATKESAYISKLLNQKDKTRLGQKLSKIGVEYIILSKNADYDDYKYLNNQPDLKLLKESPTLKIYKNLAY